MKINQLAAQLYSVRDFLKTPTEIAGSLKKIRAIGYQAIQLSGLGPIAEAELVKLCRDTGLTICATHEPGDKIFSEPHTIVARLQKLGCQWFAVEQDICPGNPFDSLRQSFNYIRDYLCSR